HLSLTVEAPQAVLLAGGDQSRFGVVPAETALGDHVAENEGGPIKRSASTARRRGAEAGGDGVEAAPIVLRRSHVRSMESRHSRFERRYDWIPYYGAGLHQPLRPIGERAIISRKPMHRPEDDVAAVRPYVHSWRHHTLRTT